MGIAFWFIMMNAQILTKTLVPSGQTTPQTQNKRSGSDPGFVQEASKDTSDPVARLKTPSHDAQDGQPRSTSDPDGFKRALKKTMARPDQEQPSDKASEDLQAEQSTPTDTTAQATMVQPQAVPLVSPLPEVLEHPIIELPAAASSDQASPSLEPLQTGDSAALLAQTQATQDQNLVHMPETIQGQHPEGQTPELSSSATTEAAATQQVAATQLQDPLSGQSQNMTPKQMPGDMPGLPRSADESVTLPQASKGTVQSEQASNIAEPAIQTTAPSEATSSQQQGSGQSPQHNVLTKDAVSPRNISETIQPPTPQPSSVRPEFQAQSLPKETLQDGLKGEPVVGSPAEQLLQTDASGPSREVRPVQQPAANILETPQSQTTDSSKTLSPAESAQDTPPVLNVSETQPTTNTPEVSMLRTPDQTPNTVSRQIQNAMAMGVQQNSNQIVIRLDPPELGRVAIRFQEDSQGITGVLEVQRPQTRADLQHAMPEIIQQLQDSGVQIKRVEVLLSADSDRETFEEQAFAQTQDQDMEHQQTSEQDRPRHNTTYGPSPLHEPSTTDPTQDQFASNQGINLLI